MEFRRSRRTAQSQLCINGKELERVDSVKFLGIHMTEDLTWSLNTCSLVKRAQQRLFFQRKLKQAGLPPKLLVSFYRSTIESVLCQCCTVWYASCTVENRRDLSQVVKTAQRIVGTALPDLDSVYTNYLQGKARSISTDKPIRDGLCLSPFHQERGTTL